MELITSVRHFASWLASRINSRHTTSGTAGSAVTERSANSSLSPSSKSLRFSRMSAEESLENPDLHASDVAHAAQGDPDALSRVFARCMPQLDRMIQLRLDPKLRARVGVDDILQETIVEALHRLPEFAANPNMPVTLWLRSLAGQTLINARRHHLGVQKRSAEHEVSLHSGSFPQVDTESLARQLIGRFTSPSQAAFRAELQLSVQQVLNEIDPIDREIIVMRHFEHLSNLEVSEILGLHKAAASKRYVTALRRLQEHLRSYAGPSGFSQ